MITRDVRRRIVSAVMTSLCLGAVLAALVPVAFILSFVITKGIASLNLAFFTHMPAPVGEAGGGMANAIFGTTVICAIGALFAIPVGVMAGLFIAEHPRSPVSTVARFAADALNGIPSIVIGVFVYTIAVMPVKQFSSIAGGLALGVMMIPLITRTTEELIRLVPPALKEGALALGATPSRAVFTIVLPAAMPGIITGIVLALARIAGETAPLIFTSFNNRFWSTSLTEPMASLTVQIYTYALSPYDDWHRQAWAGALVLVSMVLVCSVLARLATRRLVRMQGR